MENIDKTIKRIQYEFRNHQVLAIKQGQLLTIDWRNLNGEVDNYIRYIFDGLYVFITGYFGDGILKDEEMKLNIKSLSEFDFEDFTERLL
jgi:hypothetical protein